MDIQQAFKMSFKSLMASKLRSILTMLGIIIGVAGGYCYYDDWPVVLLD